MADKKQFSNTKSIVKVETGIVTLISYRHYLKIVGNNISYLRVDPWALRLYHPEALLYSLRQSRRLYSGAEGWYNLNAHG